jgi:flagellar protein FlaG
MINSIKAGAAISDDALNDQPQPREPAPRPAKTVEAKAASAAAPDSNLRLVIERDANKGYYVYRLIDRMTGKVVIELPRGRVSELATTPSYEAGTVVSTKA